MQRARAQILSSSARERVRRPLRWMVPDPLEVRDESLIEDSSSVRLPSKPGSLRNTTSVVIETVDDEKKFVLTNHQNTQNH